MEVAQRLPPGGGHICFWNPHVFVHQLILGQCHWFSRWYLERSERRFQLQTQSAAAMLLTVDFSVGMSSGHRGRGQWGCTFLLGLLLL